MEIKETTYPTARWGVDVRLAYTVKDKVILFSGLERYKLTTINGAEKVIVTICALEKIRWQDGYQFIDVQTARMYTGYGEDYYNADLLVIKPENESFKVTSWKTIIGVRTGPMTEDLELLDLVQEFLKDLKNIE